MYIRNLIIILITYQLLACATVGSPDGGPKDVRPPRVIIEKTSKNLVTNSTERKWFFTFDEFVKINNPNKNIIVSPPLTYPMEVRIKGKTVSIELDDREELKENTTYIFNFSDAIQDITEGNAVRDMQHIFSTGEYIDSLSVRGQVVKAFSGDTLSNLSVFLYDDLSDSAFFLQKPYYLSFTDSNGIFSFDYLRMDSFRLMALVDDNANLMYDGPPEQIAFFSEVFVLDSNITISYPLTLFTEESIPPMQDYKFQSGLLTVEFEHRFYDTPSVELVGISVEDYRFYDNAIDIWYTGEPENNGKMILQYETLTDTLKLRYLKSKDEVRMERTKIENKPIVDFTGKMILNSKIPIENITMDSIFILLDSTMSTPLELELIDNYSFELNLSAEARKTNGVLVFDNGAFEYYDGSTNDSSSMSYKGFVLDNTGNLFLEIQGLDSSEQYVVYLKSSSSDWEREWVINEQTVDRDSFYYLQPGILEINIIEDQDRNGRWSSGSFLSGIQPERVFTAELKGLKANWDLQTTVKTKF